MKQMIDRNAAQCAHCKDIIDSKYRHDFKSCKCGKISVDGGFDYIKRSAADPDDVIELSEYKEVSENRKGE